MNGFKFAFAASLVIIVISSYGFYQFKFAVLDWQGRSKKKII